MFITNPKVKNPEIIVSCRLIVIRFSLLLNHEHDPGRKSKLWYLNATVSEYASICGSLFWTRNRFSSNYFPISSNPNLVNCHILFALFQASNEESKCPKWKARVAFSRTNPNSALVVVARASWSRPNTSIRFWTSRRSRSPPAATISRATRCLVSAPPPWGLLKGNSLSQSDWN